MKNAGEFHCQNIETLGISQLVNIEDKIQKSVCITRWDKNTVEIEHKNKVEKCDECLFGLIGGKNLEMIDFQLALRPMLPNHSS